MHNILLSAGRRPGLAKKGQSKMKYLSSCANLLNVLSCQFPDRFISDKTKTTH
jgi:hypothetical protein